LTASVRVGGEEMMDLNADVSMGELMTGLPSFNWLKPH